MIKFFKFKKEKKIKQLVVAVDYPDKVVFETYFQLESWVWTRTDILTIETKPISVGKISDLVLEHLKLSKSVKEKQIDFTKMQENYKKLTGFSSIKKQMLNSRSVNICRDNDLITFEPTRNGGTSGKDKGYTPILEKKIEVDYHTIKDSEMGRYLVESFLNCE